MNDGEQLNDTLATIHLLARMALAVSPADVRAVLDEMGRMHALMPILDPTGYRRLMDTSQEHERLVRAFLTFRQEIDRLLTKEAV